MTTLVINQEKIGRKLKKIWKWFHIVLNPDKGHYIVIDDNDPSWRNFAFDLQW